MKVITIVTDDFIKIENDSKLTLVPRGSIIQIYNIIKYLTDKYDIRFRVLQMGINNFQYSYENIEILSIKSVSFEDYKEKIKEYCSNTIVHFNNIDLYSRPFPSSEITATIHTNAFIEKEKAAEWLKKHLLDFKKIIVVNKEYKKIFNHNNVDVINNGVDLSVFKFGEKHSEPPYIIFFPNIPEPCKNLSFAIDLINQLNKSTRKQFVLKVAGEDKDGISSENIKFIGNIKYGKDMHSIYQSALITIIPSNSESCSLCMLESMASGTIVIANDIIGLKDYMINKKTGYIYSVNNIDNWINTIDELTSMPDLYRNIAMNAHSYIKEKYTICLTAKKYLEMWRELMYE